MFFARKRVSQLFMVYEYDFRRSISVTDDDSAAAAAADDDGDDGGGQLSV